MYRFPRRCPFIPASVWRELDHSEAIPINVNLPLRCSVNSRRIDKVQVVISFLVQIEVHRYCVAVFPERIHEACSRIPRVICGDIYVRENSRLCFDTVARRLISIRHVHHVPIFQRGNCESYISAARIGAHCKIQLLACTARIRRCYIHSLHTFELRKIIFDLQIVLFFRFSGDVSPVLVLLCREIYQVNDPVFVPFVLQNIPDRSRLCIARNGLACDLDVLPARIGWDHIRIIKQILIGSDKLIMRSHSLCRVLCHGFGCFRIIWVPEQGNVVKARIVISSHGHTASQLDMHRPACCNGRIGKLDRILVICAKSQAVQANIPTDVIRILSNGYRVVSLGQIQVFGHREGRLIRVGAPVRLCGDDTRTSAVKVSRHILFPVHIDAL